MKCNRFRTSAPSMVFGPNLMENVRCLSGQVDNVEIVLFHTPLLNNIPEKDDITRLGVLAREESITYTVHLPASLEIASADPKIRRWSIEMAIKICHLIDPVDPLYYILHVPVTPPTLTPVPGLYFYPGDGSRCDWSEWTKRALEGISSILKETDASGRILVENINYSPVFLEPLIDDGGCLLCIDTGHLILGKECVEDALERYRKRIREIHLHGVVGWDEHLSLEVFSGDRLCRWFNRLAAIEFGGILNIEVFSPEELAGSFAAIITALNPTFPEFLTMKSENNNP